MTKATQLGIIGTKNVFEFGKKSEIRISGEASVEDQPETNSNFQNSNFLNFDLFRTFRIWVFGIVSNFGFRASDLNLLDRTRINPEPGTRNL
jgi:hypothetical protein